MSIAEDCFPKSLLKDVIKKQFKDDIEIVSTNISYLVPQGENYTCELLKIVVTFTEKESNNVRSISIIAKRLLDNKFTQQFNKDLRWFDCELDVYGEILPMMEKLKNKKKFTPTVYHIPKNFNNVIFIEDLSAINYKMANREDGLNLEHCLFTIKKLAYFHASSLALYEKNPNIMDKYSKGIFHKSISTDKIYSILFQETLNACKKEPSLEKYYKKITDDVREKIYDSTKRDLKFNVLNHGDFWCNNLMFRYDTDGRLDDVLFIDFQCSVFASPFLDLHYFIATSTNAEVKENHIDDILHHYYKALVENVKILEIETIVPNWNDFKKDFCNKAYIGLSAMCLILPFAKAKKMKGANIVNFIENDEEGSFRYHCFTNSAYITALKFLLPFYDSLGTFNT